MLVNEGMPQFIVDRLDAAYPLDQMTVGLLGMAYKAESDDPRFSLSYKLKKILMFRAKDVLTTDPYVKNDPALLELDEVTRRSDVLILCVPHTAYSGLKLGQKIVIDIWNFWGRGSLASLAVSSVGAA
jgi:UDP-N-acetyl-D-mannosaminuronic acid dehydrogenase